MKNLILTLAIASAAIYANAQSVAYGYPNPDTHPGYYIAPVTTVYDSRYVMYDNTVGTPDNPSNLYLADRVTYNMAYDQQYDATAGTSFAAPALLVKSRVATRVVFMPDCLQSILAQQYGVSKWKHGTVIRTADEHVYYEVNVGGKDIRFDDMCSVSKLGDTK